MTGGTWPQPYEGITGTARAEDDLLSLDDIAIPRRMLMIRMAECLSRATLVGSPAPVVARMRARMDNPKPGDLVVARFISRDEDSLIKGFGILLAHRREWWSSDEDWAAEMAAEPEALRGDGNRCTDDIWYVQYGPQERDICRWSNASFLAIPADARDFEIPVGTPDDRGVTFTRDDLIGGLADSGFRLRQR